MICVVLNGSIVIAALYHLRLHHFHFKNYTVRAKVLNVSRLLTQGLSLRVRWKTL